jgi:hypothetical protein
VVDGARATVGNSGAERIAVVDGARATVGNSGAERIAVVDGARATVGNSGAERIAVVDGARTTADVDNAGAEMAAEHPARIAVLVVLGLVEAAAAGGGCGIFLPVDPAITPVLLAGVFFFD